MSNAIAEAVRHLDERDAFKAWASSRGMNVSEIEDGWGRPKFKHEHVESIWYGWQGHADRIATKESLREVLSIVREYLPPDGISAHAAMSEIIGLVDPWPNADGMHAIDQALVTVPMEPTAAMIERGEHVAEYGPENTAATVATAVYRAMVEAHTLGAGGVRGDGNG